MTKQEARDKALAAIDRLANWTQAEPHKRGIAMARSAVGRAFDEVRQPYSTKRIRSELEAEAALDRMAAEACGPYNPAKALDARKPETAACPLWRTA